MQLHGSTFVVVNAAEKKKERKNVGNKMNNTIVISIHAS